MHRTLFSFGLLLVVFASPFKLPAADAPAAKQPNVLFIAVDDLRDWVGYLHHNEQTKTPNIDRLAKMGTAFTRSYCAAPVCNPSRAALMSGMRPSTTGIYGNETDWRKFVPEDKPLTAAFRKGGYFVCGAGKIYHESFRRPSEWDHYLENEGGGKAEKQLSKSAKGEGVGGIRFAPLDCEDKDLPDYKITDYGIEQLNKQHDKPFFLAVGLHKPHMAWNVPQKWYDMFPLESIQLPPYKEDDLADIPPAGIAMAKPQGDHKTMLESGRWKEAVQAYLAATAYTDMNIGRLLDAYDKSPHKDNTIIVFWCDHGWHLGEKHHWRKFALWEEATRSPLLWVVPGLTKAGSVCERTVDHMSIYPTLMEVCGLQKPAHVEGVSIKPLLENSVAEWKTPALTTHGYNNHGVRNERWRYIRYDNGDEELYNELTDPNEWTNLAKDPQYQATKDELAKAMPVANAKIPNKEKGKTEKTPEMKAERKKKKMQKPKP